MIRAEVHAPGAPGVPPVPWIVGNAIYLGARPAAAGAAQTGVAMADPARLPAGARLYAGGSADGWEIERDPDSVGAVEAVPQAAGHGLAFRYGLAANKKSAVVALARRLPAPPGRGRAILLRARADRPTRVSVQLRLGDSREDLRWRTSVYVDSQPREILIPIDDMRGVTKQVGEKRRADADSALIVIDRTNAASGATGVVWIDAMLLVPVSGPQVRTVRSR
jgi:hypothetical protein